MEKAEQSWNLSVHKSSECYCIRVLKFDIVCESMNDLIVGVYLIVVEEGQVLVFINAVAMKSTK